ncbi:MAG: hypothetical protein NZ872_02215 [Archaeoglobaceae archaeon]|nr:hypothetical protein [Archaeoglobaceae archaeon]MDW8128013.1 hypothetical protein [Archaeoglobaceae archaeon]
MVMLLIFVSLVIVSYHAQKVDLTNEKLPLIFLSFVVALIVIFGGIFVIISKHGYNFKDLRALPEIIERARFADLLRPYSEREREWKFFYDLEFLIVFSLAIWLIFSLSILYYEDAIFALTSLFETFVLTITFLQIPFVLLSPLISFISKVLYTERYEKYKHEYFFGVKPTFFIKLGSLVFCLNSILFLIKGEFDYFSIFTSLITILLGSLAFIALKLQRANIKTLLLYYLLAFTPLIWLAQELNLLRIPLFNEKLQLIAITLLLISLATFLSALFILRFFGYSIESIGKAIEDTRVKIRSKSYNPLKDATFWLLWLITAFSGLGFALTIGILQSESFLQEALRGLKVGLSISALIAIPFAFILALKKLRSFKAFIYYFIAIVLFAIFWQLAEIFEEYGILFEAIAVI